LAAATAPAASSMKYCWSPCFCRYAMVMLPLTGPAVCAPELVCWPLEHPGLGAPHGLGLQDYQRAATVQFGLMWLRRGIRALPNDPYLKHQLAYTLWHKPSWRDGELDDDGPARLPFDRVVSHQLPLERVADAIEALNTNYSVDGRTALKITIAPNGPVG